MSSDDRTLALLCEAHAETMRVTVWTSPIVAMVIVVLLRGSTPGHRLVIAAAITVAASLAGAFSLRGLDRRAPAERVRILVMINILGGLAWGLFFAVAMPDTPEAQLWLALTVPMAMIANLIDASGVWPSFLGFHVSFSTVASAAWALTASGSARLTAALFVTTAVYMTVLARVSNREARERVSLAVHNDQLINDLHEANRELERASHVDRLTGLPNRRALERELVDAFATRSLAGADHTTVGGQIIALFLDLDGFKDVNDTHGHHAGDQLLAMAARRLRAAIPSHAHLSRYGGDEFVILLNQQTSIEAGTELADVVVRAMSEPFIINGTRANVGASVGVAITSATCRSQRELLHEADTGLYRAKQSGRSRWMLAG